MASVQAEPGKPLGTAITAGFLDPPFSASERVYQLVDSSVFLVSVNLTPPFQRASLQDLLPTCARKNLPHRGPAESPDAAI